MAIYVFPADNTGCGWYRLRWPAEAVAAQGGDVVVEPPGEVTSLRGQLSNDRVASVTVPDDMEALVLQRPTNRHLSDAIEHLRSAGIAVVVDVDDDLRNIHPGNVAFRGLHPSLNAENNWHHTEEACRRASLVTVSTPALAERYGAHGRVAVLPNCVPESFLDVEHHDSDVVGWAGSVHSHPDDLQSVGPALARLGGPFRVVGNGEGVRAALGLREEPEITGFVPFGDWPRQVTTLGIGIAPLADTVFNAAKSWLKPLELSAVGVPWIGSDRAEYRALHDQGCGMVVDRPKDWERAVRTLRGTPALRHEMSARGREVAAQWTVEANAWRWAEAWARAVEIERQAERVSA